jgi:cell division septum initiation protein DivIVA
MGTKSNTTDTVELGGRKFKRVKHGLDEEQVVSFVNELISERDTLIKRQENLLSLTKLAERTVTEADNVAKQIKKEARDQAKSEANAIVAKAEEQAQQIIEEKKAEVVDMATREAEAIKANAQQQAESLLEEAAKRIQPELRDMAQHLYRELLSQLESLNQQVTAFEAEFEHNLSQAAAETSTVAMQADEIRDEFQELIMTTDQTNTGEPDWELQVLLPMDMTQTLEIMTFLDRLPEIEKTELIPDMEKPSIIVFLRAPIQLVDTLRALPQVAEVKEDATNEAGADGKPKKVQIALSGKTVSQPAEHSPSF